MTASAKDKDRNLNIFNEAMGRYATSLADIRENLRGSLYGESSKSLLPAPLPAPGFGGTGSGSVTPGSAAVRVTGAVVGGILGMMPSATDAVDMQQALFQSSLAAGRMGGRQDFNRLSKMAANAFGQFQTSVGAAQRSMGILSNYGFNPYEDAGLNMMGQVGDISLTTGLSNEQVSGVLGSQSTNPVMGNRLRGMGFEIFDSNGNPKPVSQIADHIVQMTYGGAPAAKQLQRGLRPGGAIDEVVKQYIPDPGMQVLVKDAIFKRTFGATSAEGAGVVRELGSNVNPRKAEFRYRTSESNKVNALRDSSVAGYTTGLDLGSNINDAFSEIASNAGILSSALQGLAAVMGFGEGFGSTTPGQVTVNAASQVASAVGFSAGGQVDAAAIFDAIGASRFATGGEIVSYARQFVGKVPYVDSSTIKGGQQNASPENGWDCATFTWYVLKHFHIEAPNYTGEYLVDKYPKVIPKGESAPGDLLLYRENGYHHIGIYAGNNELIHASSPELGTTVSAAFRSGSWTDNYTKTLRYWDGKSSGIDNATPSSPSTPANSDGTNPSSPQYGLTIAPPAFAGVSLSLGLSGLSAKATSVLQAMNPAVPWTTIGDVFNAPDPVTDTKSVDEGYTGPIDGSYTNNGNGRWLKSFLMSHGIVEPQLHILWALGMRESGGQPKNTNGYDYGLFQINRDAHWDDVKAMFPEATDMTVLFDPEKNLKFALKMIGTVTPDYSAWGMLPDGQHYDWKQYTDEWLAKYQKTTETEMAKWWSAYDSYSKGAWAVKAEEMAKIHQNEMVLPADFAEEVRHEYGHHSETLRVNVVIREASFQQATKFAQRMKMILDIDDVVGAA